METGKIGCRTRFDVVEERSSEQSGEQFGLQFYLAADRAQTAYYLPLSVLPQSQANGAPMFSLIAVGEGAYLQFNVRWVAASDQLFALREYIAELAGLEDANTLKLAFAPVEDVRMTLLLDQGEAPPMELAHSVTLTTPPYANVFNLQLSREQFESINRVMLGALQVLSVRVEARQTRLRLASGKLEGRVDLSTLDLSQGQREEVLAELILEALEGGDLKLELDLEEPFEEELAAALRMELVGQALEMMLAQPVGESSVEIAISLDREIPVSSLIEFSTDLADWFGPADPSGDARSTA